MPGKDVNKLSSRFEEETEPAWAEHHMGGNLSESWIFLNILYLFFDNFIHAYNVS